jgi:hypothetical protein
MSVRRGTVNTSAELARNVETLASIKTSKIELIDKENFLEYFHTLAGELSRQAAHAGEPFLAYLARMSAQEARSRRNQIRAQWQKSAA